MERFVTSLARAERAERYRQFARSAVQKAQATEEEYRAEYLAMASGWHSLALELERSSELDLATEPDVPEILRAPVS